MQLAHHEMESAVMIIRCLSAEHEGKPSVSRSAKMESSSTPGLLSAWEVEAALPLLILAFSMSATSASCKQGISSVKIATLVILGSAVKDAQPAFGGNLLCVVYCSGSKWYPFIGTMTAHLG